jgi:hypothetical protein
VFPAFFLFNHQAIITSLTPPAVGAPLNQLEWFVLVLARGSFSYGCQTGIPNQACFQWLLNSVPLFVPDLLRGQSH